ncbi:PD-(D/E)XK nuclease family protein [Candidatus Woesearchaeota archaeon]|nr:PD-(D/E)XK nuclease family protein [Candidatus Woesearchaeota archaeon]
MPKKKNPLDGSMYNILWSPHRLSVAKACLRRYYYNYIRKPRPQYSVGPDVIAGKLLHERVETFYKTAKIESDNDEIVTVTTFGPKKNSAEEFAKSTVGMWKYWVAMHNAGEKTPSIRWKNKQDAYRIWAPLIRDISLKLYDVLKEEGPPLFSEFESPILTANGMHMWGIMDQIRYPLTIRDFKSRKRQISETELKFDYQFTIYAAILSLMCSNDRDFALKVGATEDDLKLLKENPLGLLPKIKIEHFFLETGYVKDRERLVCAIPAPSRDENNFFEVLDVIDKLECDIESGDFVPYRTGYGCDFCFFNQLCTSDSEKNILTRIPLQYDLFSPPKRIPVVNKSIKQLKLDFKAKKKEA